MAELTKVEGIDYSPEGIRQLREALVMMRSASYDYWPEAIDNTVVLTHAIALLHYLAEIRGTENIVQALARKRAPMDSEHRTCILCAVDLETLWEADSLHTGLEVHRPDCLWRQAKEWVASLQRVES